MPTEPVTATSRAALRARLHELYEGHADLAALGAEGRRVTVAAQSSTLEGVLAGLVPAAALAVVAVALAQALRVALIDRWPETTGAALVAGAAVAVLVAAAVALVAAAIDPAVRAALTRVVPVRTRGPR